MPAEPYLVPPLLFLICAMSAMAFVISSYRWMWCILRAPDSVDVEFGDSVMNGQKQALICAMFLSIGVGFYDFFVSQMPLRLVGEIGLLVISGILIFNKVKTVRGVLGALKHALIFGALCLFGWGATLAVGVILSFVLKLIPTVTSAEYDVLVVFITGLLLNVPILFLGYKILGDSKAQPRLKGKSPHTFLWPIMFAYLVLLVPLMIQDTANSEEWHEMKRAKKIRKV